MYTTSSISINPTTVDYSNIISYKNLNLQLNDTGLFSLPLTNNIDFNYIVYNGKLSYPCIISHVNEDRSPSGICSTSMISYSGVIRNIFNYNITNGFISATTNGIIYYEFNESKLIYKYDIKFYTITYAPSTWTFDGYNETNDSWETLDTQTGIVISVTGITLSFNISNPTTKYKKYRLNITAVNTGAYLEIFELKLFEIYDKLETNKTIQFQFSNINKLCLYRRNENVTNVYTIQTPYLVDIASNIRNKELIVYAYIDSTGIIKFAYDDVYGIQDKLNNIFMLCKVYIDTNGNIDSINSALGNIEPNNNYGNIYLIKTSRTTTAYSGACSDLMNDDCLYIVDQGRNHTSYAILNDTWSDRLIHPITRGAPSPNTEQVNMNSYYYFCGSATTVLTNYVYVNNTNTWTAKVNALVVAQYHTCSVLDDLYIYSSYGSTMQMYQVNANTWTTKLNRPNSLDASAYATSNKIIYMFGGYSVGQNSNDTYDYLNNTWQSKINMPVNNYHAFARSISNVDIDQYCGLSARRCDIFRFNTINNSWTSQLNVIPLGAPSSIGSSAMINNRSHTFIFCTTTVEKVY